MQTKIDFQKSGDDIVYIRPVAVEDLPREIREQAGARETLYAVHQSDGAPVGLFAHRRDAVALARENDLTPVSVH